MRLAAPLIACAFFAAARPAAAERLESDPAIDLPITAAAAALHLGLVLGVNRQVVLDDPPASRPGGIDALAPLRFDRKMATASDVTLGVGLAGAIAAAAVDGAEDGAAGHRLVLLAETMALAGAMNETFKHAVRRPRPYTYDRREGKVDDDLSFYSGHTTMVAATSIFTARSLDLTGDIGRGGRAAAYGGAALLTATVGTLRVAAGKHYPSDVLVGAVVGAAIGWLVPELHRGSDASPSAGRNDGVRVGLVLPL